jgi:hypothetical protein
MLILMNFGSLKQNLTNSLGFLSFGLLISIFTFLQPKIDKKMNWCDWRRRKKVEWSNFERAYWRVATSVGGWLTIKWADWQRKVHSCSEPVPSHSIVLALQYPVLGQEREQFIVLDLREYFCPYVINEVNVAGR